MDSAALLELEFVRRGLRFTFDAQAKQYVLHVDDQRLIVRVDNLRRRLGGDELEAGAVASFVDSVIAASAVHEVRLDQFIWSLAPKPQEWSPEISVGVSRRVDRVLTRVLDEGRLLTWATSADLDQLGITAKAASFVAFGNLDSLVRSTPVEVDDVEGTRVAFFKTDFPAKASFMLAPALAEIVAPVLGWPVLAVAPCRDFQLLVSASDSNFVPRLAQTVAREYLGSAYPLTTEVFEIDQQVRAIGDFSI